LNISESVLIKDRFLLNSYFLLCKHQRTCIPNELVVK